MMADERNTPDRRPTWKRDPGGFGFVLVILAMIAFVVWLILGGPWP